MNPVTAASHIPGIPVGLVVTGIGNIVVLAVAGVLAGLVGTAGGITSLVSYPALLAAGLPGLAANVANIVALVACWPGAAVASQPELAGQGAWLRRWVPISALGGAAGSVLLLSTPPGLFARVVPFLVAVGSLTLLAQPRLAARHYQCPSGRQSDARHLVLPLGLTVMSLYNGYFGAGSGVMTLALLLICAESHLPTANAVKNMLIGAAALASAAVFAAVGPVDWTAVIPLGAGMFVGSTLGPCIARRLPPGLLRWLAALIGIGLAIQLWINPSG
ncbi:sulfite exporter TauE/SafE family protein [Streptantibioticus rubrisoli]|uniref:Probable membrane transporter protein n=1 Tax=Streptantibioticus rubrisoli TaxID=1387313 RepID=A0ABT1P5X5_9ACTN|nr:sulfite exporter TauE/SafE family protein [Streptantibioticus rubrisoli]MCQ4040777.1 sulfite exporter TauE/SafE family protein [Streptantibioticus rubrisoli]